MGMTRSENPFGDLPEWKERRRLQDVQERLNQQQGEYPQEQAPQDGQHGYWSPENAHTGGGGQNGQGYVQPQPAPYPDAAHTGGYGAYPQAPADVDGHAGRGYDQVPREPGGYGEQPGAHVIHTHAVGGGQEDPRQPRYQAPYEPELHAGQGYDGQGHDGQGYDRPVYGGQGYDRAPYDRPPYDRQVNDGPKYGGEAGNGYYSGHEPDAVEPSYRVDGRSHAGAGYVVPDYDPRSQITYPADGYETAAQGFADPAAVPPGFSYGTAAGHGEAPYGSQTAAGRDFTLRPARYDDYEAGPPEQSATGYAGQSYGTPTAPVYSLDSVAPGLYPDERYASEGFPDTGRPPAYYDSEGHREPSWNTDPAAVGAGAGTAAHVNGDEEYDDDEYEDDAPKRYSWKLLAAIVVTGAVVTGGGYVLYDSLKSGGSRTAVGAPIIRADQDPAKTAPVDAGGTRFAHQDSKLLGRLDNSSSSASVRGDSADADGGNRIRSVPTVRIDRDGRLILPQAPEAVAAPGAQDGRGAIPSVPGINVVDSLNGSVNSGLGGLPLVVPKSELPPVTRSEPATAVVAAASSPSAPIIRNPGGGNLTTARSDEAPPVPTKSAISSGWRMTGVGNQAEARSPEPARSVAGIRPTIAQPIEQPPATGSLTGEAGRAPASVASTGGFVAVLATAPSRVQALQSFAELQQWHPAALQNRVPDVQRADLRARGLGVMYRLVAGPAGTRGDANALCSSLKSQGYTGCWVKSN